MGYLPIFFSSYRKILRWCWVFDILLFLVIKKVIYHISSEHNRSCLSTTSFLRNTYSVPCLFFRKVVSITFSMFFLCNVNHKEMYCQWSGIKASFTAKKILYCFITKLKVICSVFQRKLSEGTSKKSVAE